MSDNIKVTVSGLQDMRDQFAGLADKVRRRVLRNALASGARLIRDDAKRAAPVLAVSDSRRAPYRKPGTVRDAIAVRTSKRARRAGNVGVFVNVRPAPAWARGAKSPRDPFYWRWLEFGTRKMAARPFLQAAAGRAGEALSKITEVLGRQIQRLANRQEPGA